MFSVRLTFHSHPRSVKVTGVQAFGAFVELGPGREGLVHVSELSAGYVADANTVIKVWPLQCTALYCVGCTAGVFLRLPGCPACVFTLGPCAAEARGCAVCNSLLTPAEHHFSLFLRISLLTPAAHFIPHSHHVMACRLGRLWMWW